MRSKKMAKEHARQASKMMQNACASIEIVYGSTAPLAAMLAVMTSERARRVFAMMEEDLEDLEATKGLDLSKYKWGLSRVREGVAALLEASAGSEENDWRQN